MFRSFIRFASFVLLVSTFAVTPVAAAECVSYEGLKHCALGNADLTLFEKRGELQVDTFDPNGGDGVTIDLGGSATSWSGAYAWRGSRGDALVSTAVANGTPVSQSTIREVRGNFQVSASFTGGSKSSTFAALVYDDGRLVGGLGSLPGSSAILIPEEWCDIAPEIFICDLRAPFHNNANGECEWDYLFGTDITMTFPDGRQLRGDELRLVEELDPAGHYPYVSFDSMNLQTSGDGIRLRGESVQ